jgi:2-oxoisovalerate dehydrogenase E1 component
MNTERHTRADTQRILSRALLARFVEESLLTLFSEGKLFGTVHTCIGQELVGSVVADHLLPGDTLFSNHRCHGHFLARHGDVDGLVAELMGRAAGVSGGIGGSQHLCKDGFYSNGIQGGIVPVAAGLALGHKLENRQHVSVVFIGDGTLGEGVVYETMNIAAKWQLPLLIVLEDNKYSQSTAQHETLAGSIQARAAAFGIETAHGDTWHWQALHATVENLLRAMRADSQPRFLHVETYRLKAHSKGDDTRARELVEPFEAIDPLNCFLAAATPDELEWINALRAEVSAAIARAGQSPFAALPDDAVVHAPARWLPARLPHKTRVVNALADTLGELMAAHPHMFLMGEDVLSPYGGAFKATRGLSEKFPQRVRNTPISEAAIVGMGTGLGLQGFRPIVEIMFGDFIGLAFDQLVNHAAKFHQMYNRQVDSGVIVRTPMGGGRGYGPTHSQTLDSHFLGVPGLRVLAMNHLTTPMQLWQPLLAHAQGPTLVIENKLLYGNYLLATPPEGFRLLHTQEAFPVAWLRPDAAKVDVTLIGYGGTSDILVAACERLFDEHDLVAQVVSVMQVYPFHVDPLLDVLTAAAHLLVVEEGQGFAGFGSELVAQLAERDALNGMRVRRLHPQAHCIPSSGPLEKELLPDVQDIVNAALELVKP